MILYVNTHEAQYSLKKTHSGKDLKMVTQLLCEPQCQKEKLCSIQGRTKVRGIARIIKHMYYLLDTTFMYFVVIVIILLDLITHGIRLCYI